MIDGGELLTLNSQELYLLCLLCWSRGLHTWSTLFYREDQGLCSLALLELLILSFLSTFLSWRSCFILSPEKKAALAPGVLEILLVVYWMSG